MNERQLRSVSTGSSITRRTGRALSQIQGGASIAVATVEARADIQAAKVDAVTAVTQRGLQGAAFISQVEQQLARQCHWQRAGCGPSATSVR